MSMDSVTGAQFLSSASQCSSPRLDDQISIKSEDESSTSKVKLMCSYGGRIMLRPQDSQLRYIGGDTRILVVPRSISYADLCTKLSKLCGGRSVFPKYKLPDEDFDALVSVICDEDLETMMEEYDRLDAREAPSKLRLFLFPKTPSVSTSTVRFDKSEQAFLEVLNGGLTQQAQDVPPDFLFGLESTAQQEVIVDAPGPSAVSSSNSIQKMIMEADSALQSELAPICTSKPNPVTVYYQAPKQQVEVSSDQLPTYYQGSTQPQQVQIQTSPQVYQTALPVPLQNGQQQALPPKHPKPRSSAGSPRAGAEGAFKEKKEKNNKAEAVPLSSSPQKAEIKPIKADTEHKPTVTTDTTSFVVEGNIKIDEEQQQGNSLESSPLVISPTNSTTDIPLPQLNPPLNLKEMSLNVFMEQQKLKELVQEQQRLKPEEKKTLTIVQPQPEQINASLIKQQQSVIQQVPQVRYQPYIIENNMIYFIADQPVQYIQRPVQNPMQIQRGGSAPLLQVAPPPAPVLQRQASAAYVEQVQRPRAVYPSPSRFRDIPVPVHAVQVQQFDGVPLIHQPLVRQPYEIDPSVSVGSQP